ncbi:transposase Tn3 family protein [Paenibacillus terrae HPL-003]|uniref:Transposase Tn3 family protein n=1 Tax=Paenibacillus terrae (strain HPL-003) TaxID=985665 RepID=G7VT84_PAETH|nr:transposase Tn3 family protein [Paenibacillus terrae HPL-003]
MLAGLLELYAKYDWMGRSITYHRTQIREFFGFREDTIGDVQEISACPVL